MNSILLALGLRSALLVLVGGTTTILLRKKSAASRNAVWRLTLFGLLALPLMFIRLPTWTVPIEEVPAVYHAVRYVQESPVLVDLAKEATPPLRTEVIAPPAAPAREATPTAKPLDWGPILVWVWLVAATASAIPLLLGLIALSVTVRRSRPFDCPVFEGLRDELNLGNRVVPRCSIDILTPATTGLFRCIVLVPEGAVKWEPDRLEMVLRHELAHVKRGDWLMRILAHIACILYAPNPLVWIASARLRAESEAACDDMVLVSGVNPKDYAKELLTIAKDVRRSPFGVATVGMAHRSRVETRLRAIVDSRRARGATPKRALLSITLCGALSVVLIASFRIVNAQLIASKHNKAKDVMAQFMIRDDVSDHPDVPPIGPSAKFTLEPYQPSSDHVVVAQNGVAHLKNGITISLNGLAPTATNSPIWTVSNQEIKDVKRSRTWSGVSFEGSGINIPSVDRTLYCSIDSPKPVLASTMAYLTQPKPKSFSANGVAYAEFGKDEPHNNTMLRGETLQNFNVWIPEPSVTDRATYRIGVGTGEWKSVLDVKNPFHSNSPSIAPKVSTQIGIGDPPMLLRDIGGVVSLNHVPMLMGPRSPKEKFGRNYPFLGSVNSSDLVARRALILDANGNLIRGKGSTQVGWYPLSPEDIRRCTHFVIQERQLEWAEFRDIPLRSNLEAQAMKAAGTTWTGTARGIAPGFVKTMPGVGTVAVSSVVIARKQGDAWTDSHQPQWRADGKVLVETSRGSIFGGSMTSRTSEAPTSIQFDYSGGPWHEVSTRVRVVGDDTILARNGLEIDQRMPNTVTGFFGKHVREVSLVFDVADGPWQPLASKDVHIDSLPDRKPDQSNVSLTGIVILDGSNPRLIQLSGPTNWTDIGGKSGEELPTIPRDNAHRWVAVLHDGSTQALDQNFGTKNGEAGYRVPARHGESARYDFLASDIKEIRCEVRPLNKTVRFDHVAVKPLR